MMSRNHLDLCVELVDDLKKQQQAEGLQERYKKLDVETIPHIPFAPSAQIDEPDEIPEGLTERQKLKLKAKQEEEKKKREEEARREHENRRQAEDDARRNEQEQKRERAEQRARDLTEHSHLMRAKQCISFENNCWRQYVILTCAGNRRKLFVQSRSHECEEGDWSVIRSKDETDTLLSYYNPSVFGDKERCYHKNLKELISEMEMESEPEVAADADSEKEDKNDAGIEGDCKGSHLRFF